LTTSPRRDPNDYLGAHLYHPPGYTLAKPSSDTLDKHCCVFINQYRHSYLLFGLLCAYTSSSQNPEAFNTRINLPALASHPQPNSNRSVFVP
jgi:hypothetical protein